jgi:hypothetical protein
MHSTSRPISPTRFATALKDLPIGSIYAKAAELANSIKHLKSSNDQLREFAEQGDKECAEAILENEEVMRNMEDRILLCQFEVETNRGLIWDEEGKDQKEPGELKAPENTRPNEEANGQRRVRGGDEIRQDGDTRGDNGAGGVYL